MDQTPTVVKQTQPAAKKRRKGRRRIGVSLGDRIAIASALMSGAALWVSVRSCQISTLAMKPQLDATFQLVPAPHMGIANVPMRLEANIQNFGGQVKLEKVFFLGDTIPAPKIHIPVEGNDQDRAGLTDPVEMIPEDFKEGAALDVYTDGSIVHCQTTTFVPKRIVVITTGGFHFRKDVPDNVLKPAKHP